jgi:hypothetical protein
MVDPDHVDPGNEDPNEPVGDALTNSTTLIICLWPGSVMRLLAVSTCFFWKPLQ